MGNILEYLNREVGIQLATHVWTTTVSSTALIAAPGSGKEIVLRYMVSMASGNIPLRLTVGTTADNQIYTQAVPGINVSEEKIHCGDNKGVSVFAAAGIGNGCIRAYYSIGLTSGTAT